MRHAIYLTLFAVIYFLLIVLSTPSRYDKIFSEELNAINQYSNDCINQSHLKVHYVTDDELLKDCTPKGNMSILGCSDDNNNIFLLKQNLTRNTIAHELYHIYQFNCGNFNLEANAYEQNIYVLEGTAALYASLRDPQNCTGYYFKCWLVNADLNISEKTKLLSDVKKENVTLDWLANRSGYSVGYLTFC